jgi:hypothetical protein
VVEKNNFFLGFWDKEDIFLNIEETRQDQAMVV